MALAIDEDLTAVGLVRARDDLDQRRFAGPVVAHETDNLTRVGLEVNVNQRVNAAVMLVRPSLVITNLHAADTIAGAVTTLMSGDPPTALFTAQNFITIQSIRTLKHLELDDCVALVGFDDFDTADLLRPAVTVVSQSPKDMGSLAAQLLLNRIDGDTTAFETHVIPVNLIERGSGELEPRADLVRARLRSTSN